MSHEAEEKRVHELMEAMTGVWSILVVDEDQEYWMNEISSLVYDPFPANVRPSEGTRRACYSSSFEAVTNGHTT